MKEIPKASNEKPQGEPGVDTSFVDLAEGKFGVSEETQIEAGKRVAQDTQAAAALAAEIRTMPDGPPPSQSLEKKRAQFAREFQVRADARNSNRRWYTKIWDKLTGKSGATPLDMAQEEAVRMNAQARLNRKIFRPNTSMQQETDMLVNPYGSYGRYIFGRKTDREIIAEEDSAAAMMGHKGLREIKKFNDASDQRALSERE